MGNVLYLSGQIGIVPGSMKLAAGGIEEEARQTMENIRISLETHGYAMSDLVKCTVMLADISEWSAFNEVYKSFFSGRYPARTAGAPDARRVAAGLPIRIARKTGRPT